MSDQTSNTPADELIARVAGRQHGVIGIQQLRELGLSNGAIKHRVGAGRLHRVGRGVFAVGHRRLAREGRFIAAVLSLPGAVVSHLSAAELWGLVDNRRGPVHMTVARRVTQRPGLRIHPVRALDPRDVIRTDGIPVTTPARTLLDLADVAGDAMLRRAVREAQVQRLVSLELLHTQLRHARGRRGAGRLRRLVDDGPAPTRSELEDRVLELLASHGLPRPHINAMIAGLPRRVEVDFLFAEHRLVVEADGARYHENGLARAADASRQAMLEAAGYRVVRVTWGQVTRAADQTVRRLRAALNAASAPRQQAPGTSRRDGSATL